MDVALLVIGGGIAVIVLAMVAAWRASSARTSPGARDDGGAGYMYTDSSSSFSDSNASDCGPSDGGGSGAGCDGGGGDGGGGGSD